MNAPMETVFGLLGGLAVFLFGMNMMSESLQKAAGAKMKSILSILTSNPVLGVLARGGEMSQAEVARALNVTAATVAVSAARLENLGYVARRVNEDNRRANVIGLTEAGKAEARRLGDLMDRVSREALRGLTAEERARMLRLCDVITGNLRAGERAGEEEETC